MANLDFENTSSPCPDELVERSDAGLRTCGIRNPNRACSSVMFDTYGIPYTRVCGKVLAYQYGFTNGWYRFEQSLTTDSDYVDGVSLTHGSNPRQHIWTFVAALDTLGTLDSLAVCECSNAPFSGQPPPAFVGQDYFCDSGPIEFTVDDLGRFFDSSPLWDGSGCGRSSSCCSFNNPPWFHRELPSPTSDAIEMRVCSDEERSNEDIPLSLVAVSYTHLRAH